LKVPGSSYNSALHHAHLQFPVTISYYI
jgi:hypothetical protein